MQAAIRLCDQWTDVPRKLTSTFWSGGEHAWKGGAFEDAFLLAFRGRLDQ
eukprot:gene26002-26175_t